MAQALLTIPVIHVPTIVPKACIARKVHPESVSDVDDCKGGHTVSDCQVFPGSNEEEQVRMVASMHHDVLTCSSSLLLLE